MKTLILILALAILNHVSVFSQGCLPGGIDFQLQSEIDSFQIMYPGCTEIEGNVAIWGSDITNLLGLIVLTSINGAFGIGQCQSLLSLTGLDNLTSVGWYIWLQENHLLTSLEGLGSLNYIGGGSLAITWNDNLVTLNGLENLEVVNGSLYIVGNDNLTNISSLKNIDGNLIQGLRIFGNSNLQDCDIMSICNYLISPNDTVEIHDNAPGCNSPEEVQLACLTSVDENITKEEISLFPNPASSFITLTAPGDVPIEEVIIYNHLGQKVLTAKPVKNTVDVSGLKAGMYILEVVTLNRTIREVLLVE